MRLYAPVLPRPVVPSAALGPSEDLHVVPSLLMLPDGFGYVRRES